MAISKEQWAKIEEQLSLPWGRVEIKCDGYAVTACVSRDSKTSMRYHVAIYVDGYMRGEWFKGEAEEAKKFCRPVSRPVLTGKLRQLYERLSKSRALPAAERKRNVEALNQKHTYWTPTFPNGKAFCRHIRKTCTDIELMTAGAE
ncbi:hypothetical protein [Rhodocyclus tenuis]|uniref:Uncharacterized protein n=1 Tax=Rhodocyclus tenuis TaxID=1066 RepID=A0A840FZF6_RHOTE|nr:hypothetical protein [Rhodocyclus tenuis]MBB4247274.1 hypothetical protein [Rhodocyclus tenuis]